MDWSRYCGVSSTSKTCTHTLIFIHTPNSTVHVLHYYTHAWCISHGCNELYILICLLFFPSVFVVQAQENQENLPLSNKWEFFMWMDLVRSKCCLFQGKGSHLSVCHWNIAWSTFPSSMNEWGRLEIIIYAEATNPPQIRINMVEVTSQPLLYASKYHPTQIQIVNLCYFYYVSAREDRK